MAGSLACKASSTDDRVGGQSGDDGDLIPPGGAPPWEQGCEEYEERAIAAGAPTQFGPGADALLVGIGGASTAFWVAYDTPFAGTSYAPGPGQTQLSMTLSVRTDADEAVTEWGPPASRGDAGAAEPVWSALCAPEVRIPAWLELRTQDGALDERVPANVLFHGAHHAELSAELPAATVRGDFQIIEVGKLYDVDWRLESLYVSAQLWENGSAGSIRPSFERIVPIDPRDVPPPPDGPSSPAATPPPNAVSVPESWGSLLVWPRREVCRSGGSARAPEDTTVGVSAKQIVDVLAAASAWSLPDEGPTASARFQLEPLPALLCEYAAATELGFEAAATLRVASQARGDAGAGVQRAGADAGSLTGSPLSDLSFRTDLSLRASINPFDELPYQIRFQRRRTVDEITREAVAAELGIDLDALGVSDEYQRFWWSWAGELSRAPTGAWTGTAVFLLSSLNPQQQAAIDQRVATGGPGASVSGSFLELGLPGDVLVDAYAAWGSSVQLE